MDKNKSTGKILVVDDDKMVVFTILKIISKEGFRSDFALDGESALSKAFDSDYDLVLLDICMPDNDGFEVCRKLKSHYQTRHIPIIFISALDFNDPRLQDYFDLGALDFLKKPINPFELIFKIRNHINRARREIHVQQNEKMLKSLLEDNDDFVVRYDSDGTLTFVNNAFSRYLGKPIDDLIGANFFQQLNIDQDSEIRSGIVSSSAPLLTQVLELKRPDGEVVWHEWFQRTIVDKSNSKIIFQCIGRDITESKKSENVLKQYEFIFKHSSLGLVAILPGSIYLDHINDAYAKMHGYEVEELQGKKLSTVYADGSDQFVKGFLKKLTSKGNHSFRSVQKRKNGTQFPALTELSVLRNEKGNISMFLINCHDITESVTTTKALADSEESFRTIFKNSPDMILILRLKDMVLIDVNDEFVKESNYSRDEILNIPKYVTKFFKNPSDFGAIAKMLDENDVVANIEVEVKKKNGSIYPAQISCSKIHIKGVVHVIAIVRNMENIRNYQESLRKSETKFRLLANNNYNWEFWIGPDGKYVYVSPSCERISGYKAKDFENRPGLMAKIIHPDYVNNYHQHFKNEYLNLEPATKFEFVIIDKKGNYRWISHCCNAVFDEGGNFLGRRGNNRDITLYKQSEKELRKLSTAIEQSSSAIIITDTSGIIEYVNPYFEKLTGYNSSEVIGKKPSLFKSGKTNQKVYKELWNKIKVGQIWKGEFVNKKKNGELYIAQAVITPVKDSNSEIVNFISINQDITGQKEIDRKILQTIISTEEKERIRFAQDLHDDLGPLLSTAKLYIKSFETAKNKNNLTFAIEKSLQAIDEAIISIKEISNNLSPHILRNFGLIPGINSLIKKVNETGVIRLEFTSELDERFDEVIESSIFRIVAELINNTVKHACAANAEVCVNKVGKELNISYSDNGVGFNLENALSKESSRGLKNILNRTKSLGGDISFESSNRNKVFISIPLNGS